MKIPAKPSKIFPLKRPYDWWVAVRGYVPGTSRSMMTIVGGILQACPEGMRQNLVFCLINYSDRAAGYKALTKGQALIENLEYGPMCLVV